MSTLKKSHKRTKQFRFCDLQFHGASGILTFDAPVPRIRWATAVNLYLDTQKNSIRGDSITMEATEIIFGCAVGAAAEPFLHLRLHCVDLDTPICNYLSSGSSEGYSVTSRNVRGFTDIGYVPKSREIYQKEPVMPLLIFRSFIIFYLRRFTILNEVGFLTDGDTSKSHDSLTTFNMALFPWPKC